MYLTKNRDHHWFIKLPVLLVYLLFFAVQIFFNLDVTHKPFSHQHTVRVNENKTVHAANIKQGDHKTPGTAKIRLNKRFQPSSLPYTISSVAELPLIYATISQEDLHSGDLYSSVFLYTHSLRGPPVFA